MFCFVISHKLCGDDNKQSLAKASLFPQQQRIKLSSTEVNKIPARDPHAAGSTVVRWCFCVTRFERTVITMTDFGTLLHEYVFVGGIKKGGTWGGNDCYLAIPLESHLVESTLWAVCAMVAYFLLGYGPLYYEMKTKADEIIRGHVRTTASRATDVIFALMHWGIWSLVVYYKICLHSLANLLQPCHLLLLLQGIAVSTNGSTSALIGCLSFPLIVGAVLGILVPATEGLDHPYEEVCFWIQHYLMMFTALYLLLRNNQVSYKLMNFHAVVGFGNWLIFVFHMVVYLPMDRYFQVNIQFFLCPSEGMKTIFNRLPWYTMWPTYRSTFGVVSVVTSVVLYYVYSGCVSLIVLFMPLGGHEKSSPHTSKNSVNIRHLKNDSTAVFAATGVSMGGSAVTGSPPRSSSRGGSKRGSPERSGSGSGSGSGSAPRSGSPTRRRTKSIDNDDRTGHNGTGHIVTDRLPKTDKESPTKDSSKDSKKKRR